MKGSMRRRGRRGLWTIDLRVPDGRGGWRTVTVSTHTADRDRARAMRDQLVAQYLATVPGPQPRPAAKPAPSGGPTLQQWMQSWMEYRRAAGIRPSTLRQYADKARLYIYPAMGHIGVADLRTEDIRQWLVGLSRAPKTLPKRKGDQARRLSGERLSTRTVQLAFVVLNAALQAAVRQGVVATNPCAPLDRPRAAPYVPRPLSPDELSRLLVAARGTRLEALWIVLAATGLRIGEALALRWQDLDLEAGTIQVQTGKTRASRRLLSIAGDAGPGPVVAALRAHRAIQAQERLRSGPVWRDMDLVFTSRVGTALSPQNLARRDWGRLLERAGLPALRRHDLRHTAGSIALRETGDPKAVQLMLGHASEAFFLRVYAHALPGSREAVGAAMAHVVGSAASPVVKLTTKGTKRPPRRGGGRKRKPLAL